jgi:hypothetical protein
MLYSALDPHRRSRVLSSLSGITSFVLANTLNLSEREWRCPSHSPLMKLGGRSEGRGKVHSGLLLEVRDLRIGGQARDYSGRESLHPV